MNSCCMHIPYTQDYIHVYTLAVLFYALLFCLRDCEAMRLSARAIGSGPGTDHGLSMEHT